jgi:hypothetical protein
MFGTLFISLELIVGKGQREELDESEGKEVSIKMRQVVERELSKEKSKL